MNIEKYFTPALIEIFTYLENLYNSPSEEYKENFFYEHDHLQLSQKIGNDIDGSIRKQLKRRGFNVRSGDPKDTTEDDIIFNAHRLFDIELKYTMRSYTPIKGEIATPSWYTGRFECDDTLRNFIIIEGSYENGIFKFEKIYISFHKISYMDIHSTNITEDFVKQHSTLITLH